MNEETVTITKKEYNSLLEDAAFLSALQAMGVDNWQGYDEARAYLRENPGMECK